MHPLIHPLIPPLSLLVAVTALVCSLVNSYVPDPYLDEVFHIPQAQLYCTNTFRHWDPKLTTPPGLYLLSYPLSFIATCSPSHLRFLNAVGIALVLPTIVYHILLLLHPHERSPASRAAAAHTAVNVALFPLLFFFAGMYYTDVYSTIFVLASYMFWLQGRTWCSAAASWAGLWFRQTNVLWTAFLVALEGVRALELAQGPEETEEVEVEVEVEVKVKVKEEEVVVPQITSVGKRKRKKGRVTLNVGTSATVAVDPKKEEMEEVQDGPWTIDVKSSGKMNNGELGKAWEKVLEAARKIRIWNPVFTDKATSQDFLFSTPTSLLLAALHHPLPFLASTAPYLLVLLSFVIFIIWNDFSIVLGDKSAHQPTLHIPQLYYFALFTLCTSWPLLVSPSLIHRFWADVIGIYIRLPRIRRRRKSFPRKPPPGFPNAITTPPSNKHAITTHWTTILKTTLTLSTILISIRWNTYLHPYLLADNRHFVFYIFRRTILAHWSVRYLLSPLYLVSVWVLYDALASGVVSVVWVFAWTAAVIGTLVGAGLVEGRYFIAAWVLWRLHVERLAPDWVWRRYAETAGFALVDGVVLFVFLNWGFEWESEKGSVQRFMW